MRVTRLTSHDLRFPLAGGAGSDARHPDPVYSFATCVLESDADRQGTGIALTLGRGNELVAAAIDVYAARVVGVDVGETFADLGAWWRGLANDSQLRWLGPHKGVVHLALAAVTGALVDLWARRRGQPLWRALLDLTPEEVVALVDFSTLADVVSPAEALDLLRARRLPLAEIAQLAARGYPAYDTSIGWLGYSIERLVENAASAVERGFTAVKVKVGSERLEDDVARVAAVRAAIGPDRRLMVDANQCWSPHEAIAAGRALAESAPYWLEEPVHPDDVFGYLDVARALAPLGVHVAGGEHLPNQVCFKSFLRAGALGVAQPDAVRLGGLPEFLGVALLATKLGVPIAPHVGDMGQLHQHLTVFTRCALGTPELPLERIPHLAERFAHPARVAGGRYLLPTEPGAGTAFTPETFARFAVGGERGTATRGAAR